MDGIVRVDGVGWVPGWVIGALMMLAAAVLAASIHGLLLRGVRRLIGPDRVFLNVLVERTRDPTRLALVIFAAGVVLPLAPFDDAVAAAIAQLLTIAFILLMGWFAVAALNLAAALYLRRFQLDVADNLHARRQVTQTRILVRTAAVLIMLVAVAAALMTIEPVRKYGVSLLAAGGAAGLIVGLAAQPLLSNLIAGLQLAVTQPIRIDDALLIEGEWGTVEEITATYVVVKIWDWRRLIVPLKYFIERPFQNWTRETASLIGVVTLHVDYKASVPRIRDRLMAIAKDNPLWDGRVVVLQVVEALAETMQLRALVSARNAPMAWDLRCEVREKLIEFLQAEHPEALPRRREDVTLVPSDGLQVLATGREARPERMRDASSRT